MKISVSKLQKIILYFMIFYVFDKNLFDLVTFGVSKIAYYAIVFVGAILCLIKLSLNSKYRKIVASFILYVAVIIANGLLYADAEHMSVGIIEYITYPLAFFALLYYFNSVNDYYKLFLRIIYWSGFTSILAVIEYLTRKSLLTQTASSMYTYYNGLSSFRAVVFVGSPMMLGILLAVSLIVAVYFLNVFKNKKLCKIVVLDLMGLMATGSRGPLLFCVVGIAVMYIYFFKQRIVGKSTFIKIFFLVMVALLFTLGLIVNPDFSIGIPAVDTLISRFSSVFNTKEYGNAERLTLWTYYLNKFSKRPIMGYGIATTSAAISTNAYATYNNIVTESGVIARLVETGLMGTLTYYGFMFVVLKCSIQGSLKMRYKGTYRNTAIFVVGVIVLILLEDIILQISLDLFCTFAVWMILAFSLSMRMKSERTTLS